MIDVAVAQSWRIVSDQPAISVLLVLLILYFAFRHFVLVLVVMDVVLGWLRQFRWFPGTGRRVRASVHWLIALGLLIGFLLITERVGLLSITPKTD